MVAVLHLWGIKKKKTLYETCTFDLANEVLQSIKANVYLQGKHLGSGPNLLDLESHVNPTPSHVVDMVNKATTYTPMYKAASPLTSDRESARYKRKTLVVIEVEDDASHC